jgi:pyruvate kinase
MRQLALSYGVFASYQPQHGDNRDYLIDAMSELRDAGRIKDDDYISYLSGSFGVGNGTSFLEINQVKKILGDKSEYVLPDFKKQ